MDITAAERDEALFRLPSLAVWELDLDGRLLRANEATAALVGVPAADLAGTHFLELVAPRDRAELAAAFGELVWGEQASATAAFTLLTARGPRDVAVSATWARGGGGGGGGRTVLGTTVDLTPQRRATLRDLAGARSPSEAVTVIGLDGMVLWQDESLDVVLGDGGSPAVGEHMLSRLHPDDLPAALDAFTKVCSAPGASVDVELRAWHVEGRWCALDVHARNRADDPAVGGIVVTTRDADDRRRSEEQLLAAARRDALTGAASRAELEAGIVAAGDRPWALLMVDLDRFASINESWGHAAGDEVLRAVAALLEAAVPEASLVARFGADAFALLLPGDLVAALEAAAAVRRSMSVPFRASGHDVRLTTSVGVAAAAPGEAGTVVLQRADGALRAAKRLGRDRVEVADAGAHERAGERLELLTALHAAVATGRIEVHHQPLVDLVDGVVVGFEALARWDDPRFGSVPPERFVALAEESDLVLDLGRLVLRRACADAAAWGPSGRGPAPTVSVNVAARQLVQGELVADAADALSRSGLDASRLCVEVTESALAADLDRAGAVVGALRRMGVSVVVDDFGTGWSSFGQLKRFQVDQLKVDRGFVDGLGRDVGDTEIVRAVTSVARALGLGAVAEGVEHLDQVEHLRTLGCRVAQGFFFSAAVPADQVPALRARIEAEHLEHAAPPAAPAATPAAVPSSCPALELEHELRNPLAVVQGFVELLDDAGLDERGATAVSAIRRSARTMAATLDAFARAPQRPLEPAVGSEDLDLDALVADVVDEVRPVLHDKRLVLRRHGGPAVVAGDRHALRRCAINLLVNAQRHTPPGTTVAVSVGSAGGRTWLEVADDGPGVPEEQRPRLFDRFARDGAGAGRGLGLHLARATARAHGGDLRHRPSNAGGAAFVLELPTAEPVGLSPRTGAGRASA